MSTKQKAKNILGSSWGQKALILIIIFVVLAVFQRKFFLPSNWLSILRAISIYGIMVCGMFFAVLVGGVDLSVGSTAALSACIVCMSIVDSNYAPGMFARGVVIAFVTSIAIGIVHGELVTRLKMNAFVVTLASKYTVLGIAMVITNGTYRFVNNNEALLYKIGIARFLGIPVPICVFIIFAILCAILLNTTTYGRRLYAVGGNPNAAGFVGIKSRRQIIVAYVICSVSACIGGILLSAMNAVGSIATASGYEGSVLMAVIIGGIDLGGGDGTILDALFGALLIGIINNIMILVDISADNQQFVRGVIILGAMALNIYTSRRSQGLIRPKKHKETAENKS